VSPVRLVVIDNYDSFTYNLVQYFEELGALCDVRLNDQTTAAEVEATMPHGVVLSPGPGGPDDAGVTLSVVARLAGLVPMLGVCLGHQALGQHFGARVRQTARPVHGRSSPIVHDGRGMFTGLPSPFSGARYHSLTLDEATLPEHLMPTARTVDGELMGIRHSYLPIEGIQFHPESILSEHGKALLDNWLHSLPLADSAA
jgi:anthranilate synthase/aminodeoxychorismate synthase-like glutamine amidotransferase